MSIPRELSSRLLGGQSFVRHVEASIYVTVCLFLIGRAPGSFYGSTRANLRNCERVLVMVYIKALFSYIKIRCVKLWDRL